MKLPDHFPHRAGQAKNALRFQLSEYMSSIRKLEDERIPTTLEECIEPSLRRDYQLWREKIERKKVMQRKIEEFLVRDASMFLVAQSAYPSGRRNGMVHLPGFAPHYPNALYTTPAIEGFSYPPIAKEKSSMVGKLFGSAVASTTIVPPVGRRPNKRDGLMNAVSAAAAAASAAAISAPETSADILQGIF